MRITYAVTAELAGPVDRSYLGARALTRRWLAQQAGEWPATIHPYSFRWSAPNGATLVGRDVCIDGSRLWRVQLGQPQQDPSLTELTTIITATDSRRVVTHISLSLVATDDRIIDSAHHVVVPPELIRDFVDKLDVRDAGVVMSSTPRLMRTSDDLQALAAHLLAPARRHPVAIMGGTPHHCSPVEVANRTAGLAHVVVIDPELLAIWRDLAPEFSVGLGDVRLCWAGGPHRSYTHHPVWQANSPHLLEHGDVTSRLTALLYDAAALRAGTPAIVRTIEFEVLRLRSAQLVTPSPADEDADAGGDDTLVELLGNWEADLERAESAEAALAETRTALMKMGDELAAVREELDAARTPTDVAAPLSVLEAVERASHICAHLEIHPDALSSAATCVYMRPDLVLADLMRLDEVVAAWRNHGLPGGLSLACREAGLDWRNDVSETARTRYTSDYECVIDGQVRFCGPHLVRGSNVPPTGHVRVHTWVDTDTRRIVVTYVGKHLRDATNR